MFSRIQVKIGLCWALLLSILVTVNLVNVSSIAAQQSGSVAVGRLFVDTYAHFSETPLNFLEIFGIYPGAGGLRAFPDAPVTRIEATKAIIKMLGKQTVAAALVFPPPFADSNMIPRADWGYLNTAFSLGIVGTRPGERFRPQEKITKSEALGLILRALKLELPVEANSKGSRLEVALKAGLLQKPYADPNQAISRGEFALLLFNAMHTDSRWDDEGTQIVGGAEPLVNRGRFTLIKGPVTLVAPLLRKIVIGGKIYPLNDRVVLDGARGFDSLMLVPVRAYALDGVIRFVVPEKPVTTVYGKVEFVSRALHVLKLQDGREIPFNPEKVFTELNGEPIDIWSLMPGDAVKVIVAGGSASSVTALRWNIKKAVIAEKLQESTSAGTIKSIVVTVLNTPTTVVQTKVRLTGSTTINLNAYPSTWDELQPDFEVDVALVGTGKRLEAFRIEARSAPPIFESPLLEGNS